jgi:triacylglycerol lipase
MGEKTLNLATQAGRDEMAAGLFALGINISPPMLTGTIGLYARYHAKTSTAGVKIVRDVRYGSDARHRLDVFAPERAVGARLPVLMFVHGGGFIAGDKTTPGSPFYDNLGLWAVCHGCIGVTMTYRLAPAHKWPAGADDVGLAVNYLREHIGVHGGDADKLFLMGQSAGAVHVASYIARKHSKGSAGWHPAAAILVSGLFDTQTMDKNLFFEAYFGADPVAYADRPFLAELSSTPVPLMVAVAQFDPLDFLRQHVALLDAYLQQHGCLPYVVPLHGHNHLSTVLHLNTADESLARHLLTLMKF